MYKFNAHKGLTYLELIRCIYLYNNDYSNLTTTNIIID